jgi:hypothetical protein
MDGGTLDDFKPTVGSGTLGTGGGFKIQAFKIQKSRIQGL